MTLGRHSLQALWVGGDRAWPPCPRSGRSERSTRCGARAERRGAREKGVDQDRRTIHEEARWVASARTTSGSMGAFRWMPPPLAATTLRAARARPPRARDPTSIMGSTTAWDHSSRGRRNTITISYTGSGTIWDNTNSTLQYNTTGKSGLELRQLPPTQVDLRPTSTDSESTPEIPPNTTL